MKESAEQRSRTMRAVKSKNTKPEIIVRKYLFGLGLRYRLHGKNLPGSPDLIFPKYRTVILVHGCFWHRHENCRRTSSPKSNTEWWQNKFRRNKARDIETKIELIRLGWKVIIVWECELLANARKERLLKLFEELTNNL